MIQIANHPILALAGQLVARTWRVFQNRRQFLELKDMSDAQLRDIGLTRADVRRASSQPFYADPTSSLGTGPASQAVLNVKPANAPAVPPQLSVVKIPSCKDGQLAA
ncbi:DUF1127 domain-containing protein [Roseibium denhamense]|uniref:YjiS-like domain-containing protein n=1 Tax=Roseibium denhamense TaxID=76305 RepID=A0ABY1P1I9_9HYPH|nr:DUF1127 domain-containing protein [Roseibium denhamense]MTI07633.1 DUF1127 domain-containing protein [Roseibium denhamense]SMP24231.1 protein of unknown function [Roseibium denhamense]